MSKYSSKNAAFQFGLLLFVVAGLSMGIILTTGKASLNLFSFAQQKTDYSIKGTPCKGSGKACSVGNIYTCTDGRYELTQNCVAGGFATCEGAGSGLSAHCIYSNGNSCNFKGTKCIEGVVNGCNNGDLKPGRDCESELMICVNPNSATKGATCQKTAYKTHFECKNKNIYTCYDDGSGCRLSKKCAQGCTNGSGDSSPDCIGAPPNNCGNLAQKCCNGTICNKPLRCANTKNGDYCTNDISR